jgi:hypothetical protein
MRVALAFHLARRRRKQDYRGTRANGARRRGTSRWATGVAIAAARRTPGRSSVYQSIVIASVVVASALVGIISAWQWGLAVLLLAAIVFGGAYSFGVGTDATTRWSEALYGDDQEDANHWSRTGGKRK